jgi:hypothetical protein
MTSPFKFLDSYTKDDKDIFFGRWKRVPKSYRARAAETSELLARASNLN